MKKAALFIIFAASIFFSLILGAERIKVTELFCNGDSFSKIIFFNIRLPRAILCLIAGITLAGSGAVFQMFFRNPLAEPGIMGVSSGATLGAVLASCAGVFNTTFFSSLQLGSFLGAPKNKPETISQVLKQSLEHEEYVTNLITTLYFQAEKEKNLFAKNFLNWFINEQLEEEQKAKELIDKYKMFGSTPEGLYALDKELGGRQ